MRRNDYLSSLLFVNAKPWTLAPKSGGHSIVAAFQFSFILWSFILQVGFCTLQNTVHNLKLPNDLGFQNNLTNLPLPKVISSSLRALAV